MVDYQFFKNRVYSKYYVNKYLPSTIGSAVDNSIFNMLLALEIHQKEQIDSIDITKKWAGNNVTWFTKKLNKFFSIPRFDDESDNDFLERIQVLINNNQSFPTIKLAVNSVVKTAINNISDIVFLERLSENIALWDGNSVWNDDNVLWGGNETALRVIFVVRIQFNNRGSNLDKTTWDYWILSKNYTKIEDIIRLYKPPGATFELLLISPPDFEEELTITSNTLIN